MMNKSVIVKAESVFTKRKIEISHTSVAGREYLPESKPCANFVLSEGFINHSKWQSSNLKNNKRKTEP